MLFASFLERLDDSGSGRDTAIALVADHGESWGERFADKEDVKGTYHMHGAELYDEVVQVPLILAGAGAASRTVVSSQVSLVDLMPTLADIAGARSTGSTAARCSRSCAARTRRPPGAVVGTDAGAVSQLPCGAAVEADPRATGEEEAYRLDLDPRERERPDDAPAEVRDRLNGAATVSRERLSAEEQALVERRLSDLGYL